jgi:hypothetical protein
VTLWADSDVNSNNRGIYTGDTAGGDDTLFALRHRSTNNQYIAGTNATSNSQYIHSSNNQQSTAARHLAVRWSSGSNTQLFVNGTLNTPSNTTGAAPTGTITGLNTFRLGQAGSDLPGGATSWDGILDEVRIADSSRSDDWITAERACMAATLNTYVAAETY